LRLYALIDPAQEAQLLAKREALKSLLKLRATVFEAIEKLEHELFLPETDPIGTPGSEAIN